MQLLPFSCTAEVLGDASVHFKDNTIVQVKGSIDSVRPMESRPLIALFSVIVCAKEPWGFPAVGTPHICRSIRCNSNTESH